MWAARTGVLDDTITFAGNKGLMRVSAAGGVGRMLTTIGRQEGRGGGTVGLSSCPAGKQVRLLTTTTAASDPIRRPGSRHPRLPHESLSQAATGGHLLSDHP